MIRRKRRIKFSQALKIPEQVTVVHCWRKRKNSACVGGSYLWYGARVLSSVVLRNYMAQTAIDHAEKGDYSEVNRILSLLETPFDERTVTDDSDVAGHVTTGELLL